MLSGNNPEVNNKTALDELADEALDDNKEADQDDIDEFSIFACELEDNLSKEVLEDECKESEKEESSTETTEEERPRKKRKKMHRLTVDEKKNILIKTFKSDQTQRFVQEIHESLLTYFKNNSFDIENLNQYKMRKTLSENGKLSYPPLVIPNQNAKKLSAFILASHSKGGLGVSNKSQSLKLSDEQDKLLVYGGAIASLYYKNLFAYQILKKLKPDLKKQSIKVSIPKSRLVNNETSDKTIAMNPSNISAALSAFNPSSTEDPIQTIQKTLEKLKEKTKELERTIEEKKKINDKLLEEIKHEEEKFHSLQEKMKALDEGIEVNTQKLEVLQRRNAILSNVSLPDQQDPSEQQIRADERKLFDRKNQYEKLDEEIASYKKAYQQSLYEKLSLFNQNITKKQKELKELEEAKRQCENFGKQFDNAKRVDNETQTL